MDKLDQQIKALLQEEYQARLLKNRDRQAPAFLDFYGFIVNELDEKRSASVLLYLQNNPEAQEFIQRARLLLKEQPSATLQEVPRDWIASAKKLAAKKDLSCPHCGKGITSFKKPLSKQKMISMSMIVLAVAAFGLSFVFKRYFLQFLALTIIFAFKYIVDQKAIKTQILVYKALEDQGISQQSSESRLPKDAFHS